MHPRNLIIEKKDRIVCVTINRPERMNAFDPATIGEMVEVFREYRDNPSEWCMIITGAGEKAFSTGMDVVERAKSSREDPGMPSVTGFKPAADIMQSTMKPIIGAVNGFCVGGWHLWPIATSSSPLKTPPP